MTTGTESSPRIGALDGLRGLAVVGIIAAQADALFGGVFGSGSGLVPRLLGAGWVGIDLFFVLSGFFITTILLDQKQTDSCGRFFRRFYVRRAFRIIPLYYGFLFIYLMWLRDYPVIDSGYPIFPANVWSLMLFYYNNAAGLHDYAIPNVHIYWALCIEMQFYLFWPLLVWSFSPRTLKWLCGAAALLTALLRLEEAGRSHGLSIAALVTPCRMDGLALGSLLALLRRERVQWDAVSRHAGLAAGLLFLALAGIAASQGHFFQGIDFRYERPPISHDSRVIQTWGLTAAVWFFTALLAFVLAGRSRLSLGVNRGLAWGPLRSLGLLSFAMYLFHGVLFHALDFVAARLLPHYGEYPQSMAKLVAAVILVAVSYAAAAVVYFVWDRPFMHMVKRWTA